MQTAIAFGMGQLGFGYWWVSLLIAFCVGAFGNHANYVIIHDATHNLIFGARAGTKWWPSSPIFQISRQARWDFVFIT
jgi:hypothetical protein